MKASKKRITARMVTEKFRLATAFFMASLLFVLTPMQIFGAATSGTGNITHVTDSLFIVTVDGEPIGNFAPGSLIGTNFILK